MSPFLFEEVEYLVQIVTLTTVEGEEKLYMIFELPRDRFEDLKESARFRHHFIMRKGRPYLRIEFGLYGFLGQPLDEVLVSGREIGEYLKPGMLVTCIVIPVGSGKVTLDKKRGIASTIPIEEMLCYTFKVKEEDCELYKFYNLYKTTYFKGERKSKRNREE